jgi:acyl-coenzyme A thioesterase PaaI-like protein
VNGTQLRRLLNVWPPFLFAGIRVASVAPDLRHARVELRQRWYNRNYVGTHFGGSLFAMTDPFWMIMLLHNLGRDYVVWDQAGEIRFLKPGRGTVAAEFLLDQARIDALLERAASGEKVLEWFDVPILDGAGDTVALVRKQIYVRRKPPRPGR